MITMRPQDFLMVEFMIIGSVIYLFLPPPPREKSHCLVVEVYNKHPNHHREKILMVSW